jgi:predicted nucleotidyltransferase component of viral defense system
MRDYLQARVLACLQREGAMIPLAFLGGTALRFLYALPRYSEDINFALEGSSASFDLGRYVRAIERDLHREGYAVETRHSDGCLTQNASIHFRGLLYKTGLSGYRDEIVSLTIEELRSEVRLGE